jgi:hypothetical protein
MAGAMTQPLPDCAIGQNAIKHCARCGKPAWHRVTGRHSMYCLECWRKRKAAQVATAPRGEQLDFTFLAESNLPHKDKP